MRRAAAESLDRAGYGRFPERIERDWLGRWCHLSEADVALARRRAGEVTRLGFAAQLVTVRATGTFLADPAAVREPVAASLARQLDIADAGLLAGYAKRAVRWKHAGDIRRRYGDVDFTSQPAPYQLVAVPVPPGGGRRRRARRAVRGRASPAAGRRVVLPGEKS